MKRLHHTGPFQAYLPYVITMITDAIYNILVFMVARGLAERQADMLTMGVFGAVFSLTFAFSSLYIGKRTDQSSNKKLPITIGLMILLAGISLMTLMDFGGAATLVAYGIGGSSAGFIYPSIMAWLNRHRKEAGQVSGVSSIIIKFCIAWNLGMILGTYTAGRLYTVSQSLPLYTAIGLCLLNLVLTFLITDIPALARKTIDKTEYRWEGERVSDNTRGDSRKTVLFVKLGWTANLGGAFVASLVLHLFPKMAVGLEIPPEQHAVILGLMRAAVIGMYLFLHVTSFWHYRFAMMLSIEMMAILGLVMLYVARNPLMVTLAIVCIGFMTGHNYFTGMFYGNAASTHADSGKLNGYHEGTIGIGVGLGSLLGGLVGLLFSLRAPCLFAVSVVILTMLVQLSIRGRHFAAMRTSRQAGNP